MVGPVAGCGCGLHDSAIRSCLSRTLTSKQESQTLVEIRLPTFYDSVVRLINVRQEDIILAFDRASKF